MLFLGLNLIYRFVFSTGSRRLIVHIFPSELSPNGTLDCLIYLYYGEIAHPDDPVRHLNPTPEV